MKLSEFKWKRIKQLKRALDILDKPPYLKNQFTINRRQIIDDLIRAEQSGEVYNTLFRLSYTYNENDEYLAYKYLKFIMYWGYIYKRELFCL